jgi:hypothetical protein
VIQPVSQGYLVQMLYVLFQKPYDEEMQIFTSLQASMANAEDEVDV